MPDNNVSHIREEVNPVFTTARACLQITAATGDEDSKRLLELLGFDEQQRKMSEASVPKEKLEQAMRGVPAFYSQVEMRFFVTNSIINKHGAKTVLDLPCGYTPRGIKLAKSGVDYYGCDLPAVIDDLAPAVNQIIGETENIHYAAVMDILEQTGFDSVLSIK